ncbi:MAG: hypothetical protein D6681_03795 [Calditrichaeota bacterium]|nr:MAG: hypothetical protein D6681_03795 [Calditrichota bacterium]
MYFCKSRNHVWLRKEDAEKCCNGYQRVIVFGREIPPDATNVQVDEKTGLRYCRVWKKMQPEAGLTAFSALG